MNDDFRVVLLVSEEYGYRDWVSVLTESQFNDFVERWKTIKGLSCLVPVPHIVPEATLIDRDGFIAAIEQADAQGDRLVRVHVHESDDSHIEGVEHTIPDADNFEFMGVVYSKEAVDALYEQHRKEVHRELEIREQAKPLEMPLRLVRDLTLLRNRVVELERDAFQLRTGLNKALDDLLAWKETG